MRCLPAVLLGVFGIDRVRKHARVLTGAAGAAAAGRLRAWLPSARPAQARRRQGGRRRAAAAGVASAPHWALRKSFHFWPLRVPADLAA